MTNLSRKNKKHTMRFIHSIRFKILIRTILFLGVLAGVNIAYMSYKATELIYDAEIERFQTIGRTFASTAEYNLLIRDTDGLQTLVKSVEIERGVLNACIFDKWGKLVASRGIPEELIDIIMMRQQFIVKPENDSAIYSAKNTPYGEVRILTNYILTQKADDVQELALFGKTSQEREDVLGYAVLIFSPTYIQAQVARERQIGIAVNMLFLIVIAGYIFIIASNFVARLRVLIGAFARVRTRDFTATVQDSSHDELADLAINFNAMVRELEMTTVSVGELRAEQQRFSDIVENTGDWIWETDMHGKYIYSNSIVEKVLGYTADEILHTHFYDFFIPEEKEVMKQKAFAVFNAQQRFKGFVNKNVGKDGAVVLLETSGLPVYDERGKCLGYRGADRDITERMRAEEERQRLEMDLHQSKKLESIGTLATGVAYEINTPVQFIGDNAEYLSDATNELFSIIEKYRALLRAQGHGGIIDSVEKGHDIDSVRNEVAQALSQTKEGVDRVSRIVRAMKDFSHLGTETRSIQNINKAIESTVGVSRNEWRSVSDITLNLDPQLPLVNCFIGEIKQVVLNVLVNAIYAIKDACSRSGSDRGVISINTKRSGRSEIIIEISDTGRGIPESIRDNIFDPFFTTKEVGIGNGQGLSMAYQTIVEKHHGKIYFTTEENKGTTFFIKLPIDYHE